ncbi:PTS sugar transporter subunit IIA [Neisseriaceae bacterium TC5R-5]|nr:PTS sugar transporter subunit IIA [Neisseriaceae bacterium TC5R-5]
MVGVLIIGHGQLAQSLADCAKHVLGRVPDNLVVMAVDKNDDPESKQREAENLLASVDRGAGVLVLTDMCGGTPSNIACRLCRPNQVEVVGGANLPMVVRALFYSDQPLDVVVQKAITGGIEGVMCMISGDHNATS